MPLNGSGSDGPGKLILMFLSSFVVEMYFIGSSYSNRGVDRNIGYCDPDNLLIIAFELRDLSFREKTHPNLNI